MINKLIESMLRVASYPVLIYSLAIIIPAITVVVFFAFGSRALGWQTGTQEEMAVLIAASVLLLANVLLLRFGRSCSFASLRGLRAISGDQAFDGFDLSVCLQAAGELPGFLGRLLMFETLFVLAGLLGHRVVVGTSLNPLPLLVVGLVITFMFSSFTIVTAELLTGQLRARLREVLYAHAGGLDAGTSLFSYKKYFILILFFGTSVLMVYMSSLNRGDEFTLLRASIATLLITFLMSYLAMRNIFKSIDDVGLAFSRLKERRRGILFSRSADAELARLASSLNAASEILKDHEEKLEREVTQRTNELERANHDLASRDDKIRSELMFASRIQRNVLPQSLGDHNGLLFGRTYIPLSVVSGDYYDIFYLPKHTFVLLADASGHGLPAALVTMAAKQAFTSLIDDEARPSEILTRVNEFLMKRIQTQDYITAFLLKIDRHMRVSYCCAGHIPGICHIGRSGEIKLIETEGLFLGTLKEAKDMLKDGELNLRAGDRILLYSDGVTEQRNAEGNEFGLERLCDLVRAHHGQPAGELQSNIIDSLDAFRNETPLADDVSMLSVELSSDWPTFAKEFNRAVVARRAGKFQEALHALEVATSILPSYENTVLEEALVHHGNGNDELAREAMARYHPRAGLPARAQELARKIAH